MVSFVLSVSPYLWAHSKQMGMIGSKVRDATEYVVRKLHRSPNPNSPTYDMLEEQIVDQFWTEFADFRSRQSVFDDVKQFFLGGCHCRAVPQVAQKVFASVNSCACLCGLPGHIQEHEDWCF